VSAGGHERGDGWRLDGVKTTVRSRSLRAVSARDRAWALVVSGVMVAAVAVPGLRTLLEGGEAPDGFPLSTYPMFARDPGRVVELATVVAVRPGGQVARLSPQLIAGTDQVIQAGETVRQAIDGGPSSTAALCREVAGGVDPPATIAVVIEEHDAVAWSAGDREPRDRRVVAECEAEGQER
jgi:hypothetical protein